MAPATKAAANADNNSDTATIIVECGGVEIIKFLCKTSKQHDVAFRVIEPDGTITGDDYNDEKKCTTVKDVAYKIKGDALDAPITVTTDANGAVSVDLPRATTRSPRMRPAQAPPSVSWPTARP